MDPFGLAEGVFLWKEKQQQASGNCNFTKGFCHFSENGLCFSRRPAHVGEASKNGSKRQEIAIFPRDFAIFLKMDVASKRPAHLTRQTRKTPQTKRKTPKTLGNIEIFASPATKYKAKKENKPKLGIQKDVSQKMIKPNRNPQKHFPRERPGK